MLKNQRYPQKSTFTAKHATHSCQSSNNILGTSNCCNFLLYHIIALDPFCCHCRRHSSHSGFTVLQLCTVIHRSLNKADCCWSGAMDWKEIKLEDAISEIVVANTDSEFWAGGEEQQKQQAAAAGLSKVEPQAATSGWLPIWGLPQGRNINIHPFVSPAKGGTWNCFPPSGSNSTQQLDTVILMWC